MKLTAEQVAEMTKLSVGTVRVYASRQKLGTREGNKRFFSKDDVKKLTKGSASPAHKQVATKKKKTAAAKVTRKGSSKAPVLSQKASPDLKRIITPEPEAKKRSFWSFFLRKK